MPVSIDEEALMEHYSYNNIGPVIYHFAMWIIRQCVDRRISRIYFLARDGYVLREVAEAICRKEGLDIECRYLYCSRYSLRMASYCILDDEEIYSHTLSEGYYLTAESVLMRIGVDTEEKAELLRRTGITDKSKPLNQKEVAQFTSKLRSEPLYLDIIKKHSLPQHAEIMTYFKQEGLFDTDTIAIADSGWTGSMQRSLRQLLDSAEVKKDLIGFYFGLYRTPENVDQNKYISFHFSEKRSIKHKVMFCNNLFECMLSANHPMTIGYTTAKGKSVPVFAGDIDKNALSLINIQINGIIRYANDNGYPLTDFNMKSAAKECYKILKRCMIYPKINEIDMYSTLTFCDDVSEAYHHSLTDGNSQTLRGYLLLPRLFRKLTGSTSVFRELYWPHAAAARCGRIRSTWYRLNIIMWDILKYLIK